MLRGTIDQDVYNAFMRDLGYISKQYRELYGSEVYNKGLREFEKRQLIRRGRIVKLVADYITNYFDGKKLRKHTKSFNRKELILGEMDYFSDEKIAVYTCVFGNYDLPIEYSTHPNNVDYYIITDQLVPSNSKLKQIDATVYSKYLKGLNNVEKNRWFKMHPSYLFPEYKYSLYVDGNVEIIKDITSFINRIGNCGIAMFWHKYNNCVYQEAIFNKYTVKKVSSKDINEQINYLKSKGMPEDYGMTTCNVIAREHNNPICKQIMDDWWNEFIEHCKRDQLSFPYVVWKNGVLMEQIATLGDDVWNMDSVFIRNHSHRRVENRWGSQQLK